MVDDRTVRILRGVPGLGVPEVGDGQHAYVATAIDFAKVARSAGYAVEYEDADRSNRAYLSYKAADIWLPVIQVGVDLLVGITGGFLVNLIQRLIDRRKLDQSILHVDYQVVALDGTSTTLRIDGKGAAVLQAIDKFEKDQLERVRTESPQSR